MKEETKNKIAELRADIKEGQEILNMTTDESERKIIQMDIDNLKKQLEKAEAEIVEKPEKKIIVKKEKPSVEKKEPEKKPGKVDKKKVRIKEKLRKEKEKKVEKLVKVSKVVPADEKKTVRELLEKEHFKVVIKEVGGKKVKTMIKHTDKTVAKNKIESAFTTVSKKVNSEEEKKKYADDLKVLSNLETTFKKIIEVIYSAFNAHNTDELNKIHDMLTKIKLAGGGLIGNYMDNVNIGYYQKRIMEITGCNKLEVSEIEDIMREDVVHSTLDWLSREQFEKAAKEAYEIFKQK